MIRILVTLTAFASATSKYKLFEGDEREAFKKSNYQQGQKCYGIALADAIDSGPYQAGALIGLLQSGQVYDVITGVSMGAINTYIMALHEKNDTQGTIDELSAFWASFAKIKAINQWPGGLVYGMFFQKGIYDGSTVNKFLEKWFARRQTVRHFSIGVTDVLTGAFTNFEDDQPQEVILKVLQASLTFAGFTPAISLNGTYYISGNAIYSNDMTTAITHCEELGFKGSEIVIDTILNGPRDIEPLNVQKANALQIMIYSSKQWQYYTRTHGLLRAQISHSDVLYRYSIGPSFEFPTRLVPTNFSLQKVKDQLIAGQRDATRIQVALREDPETEFQKRITGPSTIFYYNPVREAKHIAQIKENLIAEINLSNS